MGQCEMLDVMVGFKKEHAAWVSDQLEQNSELLINPGDVIPKHIALASSSSLPKGYHYVACRMETRSLMSAAVAAYVGDEVEFMRLYPMR